ncbi:MAG: DUF4926 domain-containing protein [Phycisphaerae bacterium]
MIQEHDVVALLQNEPESGLLAGDVGVVVFVHEGRAAYEVEFPDPTGTSRFSVVTLEAPALLKLQPRSLSRAAG